MSSEKIIVLARLGRRFPETIQSKHLCASFGVLTFPSTERLFLALMRWKGKLALNAGGHAFSATDVRIECAKIILGSAVCAVRSRRRVLQQNQPNTLMTNTDNFHGIKLARILCRDLYARVSESVRSEKDCATRAA